MILNQLFIKNSESVGFGIKMISNLASIRSKLQPPNMSTEKGHHRPTQINQILKRMTCFDFTAFTNENLVFAKINPFVIQ